MKNIKLHAIILALIIVSELIGTHTLKFGIGRIVLRRCCTLCFWAF